MNDDGPKGERVEPTVAERDYWQAVERADASRGRIAVRVFCTSCGKTAGVAYDTAAGALYACDIPVRQRDLIDGHAAVERHLRRLREQTGQRPPKPHMEIRVGLDHPDPASIDPDLDPSAVRAFCRDHPDGTVAVADLVAAVAEYRRSGRPGRVIAN